VTASTLAPVDVRFDPLRDSRHRSARAAREVADWLVFIQKEGKSPRTLDIHERTVAALLRMFPDKQASEFTVVENVPGLLSSNGGRDFGVVLGTLADLGYGVAWRILDSRFFGVPQRRRRVFIVGTLAVNDPRAAAERAGEVLAVGSRCDRHPATRGEAGPDVAGTLGARTSGGGRTTDLDGYGAYVSRALCSHADRQDGTVDNYVAAPLSHGSNPNSNAAGRRREDDENLVAYALEASDGHHGYSSPRGDGADNLVIDASVRRLMPVECERLQALPDGWTDLGGTPDSRRYAALGDAVTATVAEWVGRRIIAEHLHAQERVA